jgi:hypothetical protein
MHGIHIIVIIFPLSLVTNLVNRGHQCQGCLGLPPVVYNFE